MRSYLRCCSVFAARVLAVLARNLQKAEDILDSTGFKGHATRTMSQKVGICSISETAESLKVLRVRTPRRPELHLSCQAAPPVAAPDGRGLGLIVTIGVL